jgi:hypothetical protein
MSNRLISGPQGLVWDIEVYNADSVTLTRGMYCMWDTSATNLKMTINPYYQGEQGSPLEGAESVPVIGILKGTVTGSVQCSCVPLETIMPGEWGMARILGPGLVSCVETTSDGHLTAYGETNEAGQFGEVTAGSANAYACQIGTSGITTAGDLREAFIDCLGLVGGIGSAVRPLGTWV